MSGGPPSSTTFRKPVSLLQQKWNLPDNDPSVVAQFHAWAGWRRQALLPTVPILRRIFGWRFGTLINRGLEEIETALNRWLVRDRRRALRSLRTTLVREGARLTRSRSRFPRRISSSRTSSCALVIPRRGSNASTPLTI
jgi:hypothetical protein